MPKVHPALQYTSPKKTVGVSDSIMLPGVTDANGKDVVQEETFLNNLKIRFEKDIIYTYIGDVVVSVNPFKKLNNMYTEEAVNLFKGKYYYNVPPHIFGLAEDAYRDMLFKNRDQCVIISGESGAGKTEASKLIMQYVAAVSSSSKEVDKVKDIILQSNPILEAFGNAKTNRNNNSSRFGKYMDIQFNLHGDPVGGHINNYLLEKSRVIGQGSGERSFHIMYQLLSSGLSYLKLGSNANAFNYINKSGCSSVDGIDDKKDFKELQEAFKIVGINEGEAASLFKMVSGILHLGNVDFSAGADDKLLIENEGALDIANSLFGTDKQQLIEAMIYRTVVVQKEHVKTEQTREKALNSRDALCKELYSRMFVWLIEKINSQIQYVKSERETTQLLGVLDIYGFEVFKEGNGFEQFCINYCNEKLQQLFISLTLKREQEEYEEEGIEWKMFDFFNNDVILELIEDKATGLIASLDEECLRPGEASDQTFLDKMDDRHTRDRSKKASQFYESQACDKNEKSLKKNQFRLKHYAGDVVYDIDGFLDKNMDNLSRDIKFLFANSSDAVVEALFPDGKGTLSRSKRMVTTATSFKTSLNELIKILLSKKPHYVRCIKSNDQQEPGKFEDELCTHQIRYLGLLENVRVRRAGFVFRQPHSVFLTRYRMLCRDLWPTQKCTVKEAVEKILKSIKVPKDGYRMGKTKVFIRKPNTIFTLEEKREQELPKIVLICQKYARSFIAKTRVKRMRASRTIIAAYKKSQWSKFFQKYSELFEGVAGLEDYGASIEWPEVEQRSLQAGADMLVRIWKCWRAEKLIKSIDDAKVQHYRLLCKKHEIFDGNKQCDFRTDFKGDYLGPWIDHFAPEFKNSYLAFKRKLLSNPKNGKEIIFTCPVNKPSHNGKTLTRYLVLTDSTISLWSPSFGSTKKPRDIMDILNIYLSRGSDHLVVLRRSFSESTKDADLVLDFSPGIHAIKGDMFEKYSEFVISLQYAAKRLRLMRLNRFSIREARQMGAHRRLKAEFFDTNLDIELAKEHGLKLQLENYQRKAKEIVPCDGHVLFAKNRNIISAKISVI